MRRSRALAFGQSLEAGARHSARVEDVAGAVEGGHDADPPLAAPRRHRGEGAAHAAEAEEDDVGACLALQTPDLSIGDELILWMRFAQRAHPVPATGRVVWMGGGWGRPRYGVEWTHRGPQRQWIGWLTRS
jgi:hypothetical protein